MAITITLTQEQVLDVINQMTGAISSKETHLSHQTKPKVSAMVRAEVAGMKKGTTFRNVDLQIKLGAVGSNVSSALMQMAKDGNVKMVRRGTWQVTV